LWGAGRGFDNLAYLTCGTGIGAGLILNGRLYRGKNNLAGEIGHAVIVPDGPVCVCGKRGCLEAFASGASIGRAGKAYYEDEAVTARVVCERARSGDTAAMGILLGAARALGVGIANLLQTLDLQCVVLGSLAVYAGDLIMAVVAQTVDENCWPSIRTGVSIVPAGLGESAQDLAAVAVALQKSV
jgi:glucokinase